MKTGMSSVVEEDTKGKRVAYKDMHTLYEAEQKRADKLSRDEAARELKNGENSDWDAILTPVNTMAGQISTISSTDLSNIQTYEYVILAITILTLLVAIVLIFMKRK